MNSSFLIIQALNGLSSASTLFITACGLSLVFGVTRIINFAHGSFYMLGAYFAAALIPKLVQALNPALGFWSGILISAVAVGLVGVLFELILLRRVYRVSELYQLLVTFAAVLVVSDLVVMLFGRDDIFGMKAPNLQGTVEILGRRFPTYDLFVIAMGPLVLCLLLLLLKKTRFGVFVRAATQDREMVGVLGVNQALLFTGILFVGSFLAGLGGALQTPRLPANSQMDISIITECFVVTVVGGMGSITGAFIAAVLIGLLQAFGILILPKISLVLAFLLMAVVLVVRPWGFLGRPETSPPPPTDIETHASSGRFGQILLALCGLGLIVFPLISDDYGLKVAMEMMIMSLYAVSLRYLVVIGGLVSFGHAAYFGLGAYGAALVVKYLGFPMELALIAAPASALIGAAFFGFFIVRLRGVYLAMLSLAFAQIVYAIAFQWTSFTGGDNGIIGIWPSPWASNRIAFYYLALAVAGISILALHHLTNAPLGFALRATRDSEVRAASISINVRLHRWVAFTTAGAFAGIAGGLLAFMNGSVDPTLLSVSTSVDGLIILLLGGLQSIIGTILGAVVLHELKNEFIALTDYWRFFLGISIILLVLVMPQGLMGAMQWVGLRLSKTAGTNGSKAPIGDAR